MLFAVWQIGISYSLGSIKGLRIYMCSLMATKYSDINFIDKKGRDTGTVSGFYHMLME